MRPDVIRYPEVSRNPNPTPKMSPPSDTYTKGLTEVIYCIIWLYRLLHKISPSLFAVSIRKPQRDFTNAHQSLLNVCRYIGKKIKETKCSKSVKS